MTIAANPPGASDIRPGRLDSATLNANFADLHPPLTFHEAKIEADKLELDITSFSLGALIADWLTAR